MAELTWSSSNLLPNAEQSLVCSHLSCMGQQAILLADPETSKNEIQLSDQRISLTQRLDGTEYKTYT